MRLCGHLQDARRNSVGEGDTLMPCAYYPDASRTDCARYLRHDTLRSLALSHSSSGEQKSQSDTPCYPRATPRFCRRSARAPKTKNPAGL